MTLPDGFTVRLGDRVRLKDEGGVLIGGTPTRVVYLSAAAKMMIVGRSVRVRDKESAALADRLLDMGLANPVLDSTLNSALDHILHTPNERNALTAATAMTVATTAPTVTDVTVVVPVRDRPEELDRLLASIGRGHRVIVVDDCSHNPKAVAEVARNRGAQLQVLPVNLGPSGARNAGLRLVKTPFVAFVDSDIVLEPTTLMALARHFADPKVALVAPRILGLADEQESTWLAQYESVRSSLDLGETPSIVRPHSRVAWVPAACLVARVEALGEGFDDRMRVAEDVDLVWRLSNEGWRIRYEPGVSAQHDHRVTLGKWMARKAFYGTGADLLAKRHGHKVAPAVLAPWSVGLVIALFAQRWWSLPIALGISAVTATRIAKKLPRSEHPYAVSVWLTANGVVSVLGQVMGLLLRHWWPVTVIAGIFSARIRRATLLAAVADSVIEYHHFTGRLGKTRLGTARLGKTRLGTARLDPLRFALLRRLDDLSYGAGVWTGAIRGRSLGALLPDIRPKN